jgi:hypothetical protein
VRGYAFPLFLVVLILLHFVLHIGLGLGETAPDLMAVAVLLAARRSTMPAGALLGLGVGVIDDAMGIGPLGPRSIALALSALLGTWSRSFVEGDGLLFVVAYLFAGVWACDLLLSVVAPGRATPGFLTLITVTPLQAAYTAVAGVAAVALFRRLAGPDA